MADSASIVLGICADSNSSSAAVVRDGLVMSALEQFKIREHWTSKEAHVLPRGAILAALATAGIQPSEVTAIFMTSEADSVGEEIRSDLHRLGFLPDVSLEFIDHRLAHATAAFYSSPFDCALVLVLGAGRASPFASVAFGRGTHIEFDDVTEIPESLSSHYSETLRALRYNWRTASKLPWLAATGENVAGNFQAQLQEMVVEAIERLGRRWDASNFCVAGQLAENPLLVRAVESRFGADRVFVPPATGIESLSIGAAVKSRGFYFPALGPEFSDPDIKEELDNCKLVCDFDPSTRSIIDKTAGRLAAGNLVGWFQSRCEFGHRALGFRSILANPFTPYIEENINRYLKHRDRFHPFVISVPEEAAGEYFDGVGSNARTISSLYPTTSGARELLSGFAIPEHYVRVHTVAREDNPLFWELLWKMRDSTKHPLLINTSFNLPGEPLAMAPRDAIRSFYASGVDVLAMGRFLIVK